MSTRRRLANRDRSQRSDTRNDLPETFVCRWCRRQFATGTPRVRLDEHLAKHQRAEPITADGGSDG